MGKYFEYVFMSFCSMLQNLIPLCEILLIILLYVTLPVWVIPYLIFFKRGARDD